MCSESPAESPSGNGVPAADRPSGLVLWGSYGRFAGTAVPVQSALAVSGATLCPLRKRESPADPVVVAIWRFSVCPRGGIGQ